MSSRRRMTAGRSSATAPSTDSFVRSVAPRAAKRPVPAPDRHNDDDDDDDSNYVDDEANTFGGASASSDTAARERKPRGSKAKALSAADAEEREKARTADEIEKSGGNLAYKYDSAGRNLATYVEGGILLMSRYGTNPMFQKVYSYASSLNGLPLFSANRNFIGYVKDVWTESYTEKDYTQYKTAATIRILSRLHEDAFNAGIAYFDNSLSMTTVIYEVRTVPVAVFLQIEENPTKRNPTLRHVVPIDPDDLVLGPFAKMCMEEATQNRIIGIPLMTPTAFLPYFEAHAAPSRLMGLLDSVTVTKSPEGKVFPILVFHTWEVIPSLVAYFPAEFRDMHEATPDALAAELATICLTPFELKAAADKKKADLERDKKKAEMKAASAKKDPANPPTPEEEYPAIYEPGDDDPFSFLEAPKKSKTAMAAAISAATLAEKAATAKPSLGPYHGRFAEEKDGKEEPVQAPTVLPLRTRMRLYYQKATGI